MFPFTKFSLQYDKKKNHRAFPYVLRHFGMKLAGMIPQLNHTKTSVPLLQKKSHLSPPASHFRSHFSIYISDPRAVRPGRKLMICH